MGIGDFISGIFGSKNRAKATAPQVDANAYEYGGGPGGASNAALRYQQAGANAQNRQAAQADYGQANEDRSMGLQARGQLGQVGQMQLARAMGQTPSIAGMQAQQDMQRAAAAQTSAQASARGAAGMALAQQQAAGNTANAQAQISGQAQINAANERMQAENAAANTFGAMRGQDLQSQGQSAQQGQFNADLQARQRAQNDMFQLGMTGYETGVQQAQLAAQQNRQAQQSSNAMGAQGINAGVAGQNANMNQQNAMNFVGMLQNAAGAASMPGKAEGGPVEGGRPFIAGERGPERVVPGRSIGINPMGGPRPSPAETVISTWGTGPGVTRAQSEQAAVQRGAPVAEDERRAGERDARLATSAGPQAFVSPLADLRQQDDELVTRVRAYEEHGIPVSERDQYDVENAERRQAHDRQIARSQRPGLRSKISSALTQSGQDAMHSAAAVDTAYHGPSGGYIPPQLIPISGARAMGGPMGAGQGYLVGEHGPELVVPGQDSFVVPNHALGGMEVGVGRGAALDGQPGLRRAMGQTTSAGSGPSASTASATFAGSGGLAGGSVAGEDRAHKAFGTRFARNPVAYGDADGGPVPAGSPRIMGERGPEAVVPLYEPPGQQLHQGADGRAFYLNESDADDGRPRIESRGGSAAKAAPPAAAKAPTPASAAPRKLTPEELLAEADRQIAGIQAQEASSMAAGPAVRMPVAINKVAKRYALADIIPPARKRQAVAPEGEAYPVAPHPHDLPPPRPPPIEATEDGGNFEDSAMQQSIYDYARELQGTGRGRDSYDIARMMRSFPEGPSFASKMREAKGRR